MCGIYGVSMKKDANIEAVMAKIKILGLYNIPRGKDSCGMFIDGDIIKGTGPQKEFDDFIEDTEIPMPKNNLVVLGHNRAASRGMVNVDNAHPFLINKRLVGVHNGTISNIDELCRKNELNPKDFNVDSKALYTLIDEVGLDVLKEYKGGAALAYTYVDEPNILYLYHGASKNTKLGNAVEERPLLYLETKDGLFFSSLATSLFAIRDTKEEVVYHLNTNEVRKIENGAFTNMTIKIDREDTNIETPTIYTSPKSVGGLNIKTNGMTTGKVVHRTSRLLNPPSQADLYVYKEPLILKETLPIKVLKYKKGVDVPFVYYHQGRHFMYPRVLCQGKLLLRDKGGDLETGTPSKGTSYYYFERGILLKEKSAFDRIQELFTDKNSFLHRIHEVNYAAIMSRYSMYPISNYQSEARHVGHLDKHAWYMDGTKTLSGTFTAKFSSRNYIYEAGYLSSIKTSIKETTLFPNFETAATEINLLLAGKLLDVSGGDIDKAPFQDSCSCEPSLILQKGPNGEWVSNSNVSRSRFEESENFHEEEGGKDEYFYETVFKSFEDSLDVIQEPEKKALRKYIRTSETYLRGLEMDDKEVEDEVCDLIITSQACGKSILELCDSEEDRFRLIDAYSQELAILNEEDETEDTELEEDVFEAYTINNYRNEVEKVIEEITINNEIMDVEASVVQVLENVENLITIGNELEMDEKNDYAQELAFVIKRDMHNLLLNLTKSAGIFADRELINKLSKIIKNKELKV